MLFVFISWKKKVGNGNSALLYFLDLLQMGFTILTDFFMLNVISQYLAARKEQSALKAVIKCIEEYNLEAEFPAESLKKRLEQLEKVKPEKRKQIVVPANKRTRASNSNGGPMPPAKAGRLTNAYVSSFPAAPTFVRSPSHGQYPAALPPYPSPPHMYGSRSPSYAYSPEPAPAIAASYPVPPMSYPAYGGYGNVLAPTYQQAYYR
jgi:hypothetical protein